MFDELKDINSKPEPFEFYSAEDLWTDPHIAKKMLELLVIQGGLFEIILPLWLLIKGFNSSAYIPESIH